MLSLKFVLAALASVLTDVAVAATNKTPLFDGLSGPFNADLSTMGFPQTASRQKNITVPQVCKDYAKGQCDASKLTARRVQYSDCDDPWVMCRCDDANMSMDTLERRWAKVPAGIRSYTGAILAVKAGGCSALNYNRRFIRFHGDCDSTVFLHEAGHSLDAGFSGEKRFTDAVAKSTCVPDSYANASPAEDWTQNNVVITWAKRHGGWNGLKAKKSNADCLKPMFDVINNDARVSAAINAKKCIKEKRPFIVKRDLEENAISPTIIPEMFKMEKRQSVACNFTARA
ncbi:hypothetical protein BKA62DRAFT_776163 [Auriculariales sp. MPI-PUGE-AT-0066]|nr:hypothetical protein BKA62DRAFT_776163 [Auriculariales sp. MPI-PUGE-AT-0066]